MMTTERKRKRARKGYTLFLKQGIIEEIKQIAQTKKILEADMIDYILYVYLRQLDQLEHMEKNDLIDFMKEKYKKEKKVYCIRIKELYAEEIKKIAKERKVTFPSLIENILLTYLKDMKEHEGTLRVTRPLPEARISQKGCKKEYVKKEYVYE